MNRLVAFASMVLLTMCVASAQESSPKSTDHLTVPQWVSPETPGEISGRVVLPSASRGPSVIANATVVMTSDSGVSVRGKTDSKGHFKLVGVEPGVYAMTARTAGIFACCAMHVVDRNSELAKQLPSDVELSAATIGYTLIKSSILRYLPPTGNVSPISIASADLGSVSSFAVNPTPFRVMQTDGGLRGQIRLAGAEANSAGLSNVFLVHDGEIVDRVVSRADGSFAFSEIAAGDYSVLALGQGGVAMIGFELIGKDELASLSRSNGTETLVVQSGPAPELVPGDSVVVPPGQSLSVILPGELMLQVAPLSQAVESLEEIDEEESDEELMPLTDMGPVDQFGNPIGGFDQFGNPISGFDQFGNPIGGGTAGGGALGGGGGGFAGGGGGGGMSGGLGGLASLAGLAGLAAIGSDDNNSGTLAPPAPASPSSP